MSTSFSEDYCSGGTFQPQMVISRPLPFVQVMAHHSIFDAWRGRLSQMHADARCQCRTRTPNVATIETDTPNIFVDLRTGHPRCCSGSQNEAFVDHRSRPLDAHRDYYVKFPGERVYWQNQRFLRLLVPAIAPEPALTTNPFPNSNSLHHLAAALCQCQPCHNSLSKMLTHLYSLMIDSADNGDLQLQICACSIFCENFFFGVFIFAFRQCPSLSQKGHDVYALVT